MSSPEKPENYYDLSLEDVRLIGHALSLGAMRQPKFLAKQAFIRARINLFRQARDQQKENYPSLNPENNKYGMLVYQPIREMIGIGLDSVAELVPIHNDGVESIVQIDFALGQPDLEGGLLQSLSSSADMLGDIQRLREQLDLTTPTEA